MISHKHKCIFIHISKCAGSSIEHGFGINLKDNTEKNNKNLFGWNAEHEIFLQHATPQQLLDNKFITKEIWDEYYKFIIVRNPFSRLKSDYIWMRNDVGIRDSFKNFLNAKGKYEEILKAKDPEIFRGDHLTPQIDYFYLNGKRIKYEKVLRFENLNTELKLLCTDLSLHSTMFSNKVNTGKNRKHYSYFYNKLKKNLVFERYKHDLEFLGYNFEDERSNLYKLLFKL